MQRYPRLVVATCTFAAVVLIAGSGCVPRAMRGGEGADNPDLDRPAMSVALDRDDITYLVEDYLARLENSRFWQQDVKTSNLKPVVAIWPIRNATTQHLDDQMLTLLSSRRPTAVAKLLSGSSSRRMRSSGSTTTERSGDVPGYGTRNHSSSPL